jgi:tetratricopeptide (TPR) repeat protein
MMTSQEITIDTPTGAKQLLRVGTSVWGGIYRTESSEYFYRLLPIEDVPKAAERQRIASQNGKPRNPQVAPVVESGQVTLPTNGSNYYYVSYEAEPGLPWLEIMRQPDPQMRLDAALKLLKAVSTWRDSGYSDSLMMPADVVFIDHTPFLLGISGLKVPRLSSLFERQDRIPYLAPEILKGKQHSDSGGTAFLYAAGVTLLQSIFSYEFPQAAEDLLTLGAHGLLFKHEHLISRLPDWATHIAEINQLVSELKRLVSPDIRIRAAIDPKKMADVLGAHAFFFDPAYAVKKRMEQSRFADAGKILEALLSRHKSYDLLLMAASLEWECLNHYDRAIDYLAEATRLQPNATDAWRLQMRILLDQIGKDAADKETFTSATVSPVQVDALLEKGFFKLEYSERDQFVEKIAAYFNARRCFSASEKILYGHLFDPEKNFLWFKFNRLTLYIQALIGLNEIEHAGEWLKALKQGISRGHRRPELAQDAMRYAGIATNLEIKIFEHKKTST